MAKDKIGGGGGVPLQAPPGPHDIETPKVDQAAPEQVLEVGLADIPEKSGIYKEPGSVAGILASGLAALNDVRYSPKAKNTALNMMVQAMGASAAGASQRDVDEAAGRLKGDIAKLLKSMVHVTPTTLRAIQEDAPKLVKLAVQAMGSDALGKDKPDQLVADMEAIQAGLSELIGLDPSERDGFIKKFMAESSLVQASFAKGADALQAAKLDPGGRVAAVQGIMQIVSKYANLTE